MKAINMKEEYSDRFDELKQKPGHSTCDSVS